MGTVLKYLGYMATKWIIFYLYQYIESGENWKWERVKTQEDVYYTVWMFLALPIIEIMLLAIPLHLAIRQKGWIMVLVLVLTFTLEFAVGWYTTNQQLSTWMVVKIGMSMGLFWLFYRKQVRF